MHQMYSCPHCEALVSFGQKFCFNCGKKINWPKPKKGSPLSSQNAYLHPYPEQQRYMDAYSGTMPQKKSPFMRIVLSVAGFIMLTVIGIALATNGTMFNISTPPVVKSFSVNPSTITQGQTATLQWDISGVKSVSIDHDIGTTSSAGTQSVSPSTSTTYILSASNNAGSVSNSATVIVIPKSPPVIASFTAKPASITAGQISTLQWDVTGATSITIDQGIGNVSSTGTLSVTPIKNTTFNLIAANSAGSTTASSTITVVLADPPVINDFFLTPRSISAGKTSTLQWDVTGASSVSINQGIGKVCSAGMLTVSPSVTTTYILTATNSSSDATMTATLAVIPTAGRPAYGTSTDSPLVPV